jgi:large subunit ribosomal protein L29
MKASEIRDLSLEEMDAKERGLSQELMNLRFQKETGQLGSTARIRAIRKDIARIQTIRNQKSRG